jgi:hypothetical protein
MEKVLLKLTPSNPYLPSNQGKQAETEDPEDRIEPDDEDVEYIEDPKRAIQNDQDLEHIMNNFI